MAVMEGTGQLGMNYDNIVELSEVATVKGGKRLPKGVNLVQVPNKHPYIRVRDITQSKTIQLNSTFEYIDDDTQKQISRYIVSTGDIVLSIVGSIGLVSVVGETLNGANLTENCVKITNFNGIDRDFLYYYLTCDTGQAEIAKGTVGAVQAKLPIKNIQQIKILLPNMKIQQKIVSILAALDDKIELNQKINENLERQAAALFNNFYDHAEIEVSFTDTIQILGGGTPKTSESLYWNGDIPFFTPKDVGPPYTLTTEKTITKKVLLITIAVYIP